MDVVVSRTPGGALAWDLTDLLGRPLGQATEARGRQFFIDLNERGHILLPNANLGPHASLDAALSEIEKHMRGVCRRAPEESLSPWHGFRPARPV
jgi:hypothetical protein